MKAVILAAGMGIRLRPITEILPKCMIEIDGKSLLERSLDALESQGVREVIAVVGFQSKTIEKKIGDSYKGIKITYARNEEYEDTGSMYSLSKVCGLIDDTTLVLESDLLYHPKALAAVITSQFEDVLLVGQLLNSGDDVYICTNKHLEITALGKELPEKHRERAAGALVGISKYSKDFLSHVFDRAEKDYKNNRKKKHYEECVFETGKTYKPIYAEIRKDLPWIEIDNEQDLTRAREKTYPQIISKK